MCVHIYHVSSGIMVPAHQFKGSGISGADVVFAAFHCSLLLSSKEEL